ncbi:MAG: cytochrome c peroxidase [Pseudomonadota bacterium]
MKYKRTMNQMAILSLLSLGMTATSWAFGPGHGGAGTGRLPSAVTDADFFNQGEPNQAKVELGKNLFFDKILSGNRNASCATCHHVLTDTGDGLSLPVGEGGSGLGVTRDTGELWDIVPERVPRNAPPVFNLGALEFTSMFWDGRVYVDPSQPSGFVTPAGDAFPAGIDNALSAQAMFPVTSTTEMAGQSAENDIADAATVGDVTEVWRLLAQRLQLIDEYVVMFQAAYPDEIYTAEDITFVHAANAIGAFEAEAWRADNSPFDRFLRGEKGAMSQTAQAGMKLFYGKARCASCHSGKFQTDHQFHAIAMPQIGPGKGDGALGTEDFGHEQATGDPAHRYQFRALTLRNVALTGPWGHDGAYNSLEAVVRHHLKPVESLYLYDETQAVLPELDTADDFTVTHDLSVLHEIAQANELKPVRLNKRQFSNLMDFLHALTDPSSVDLRGDIPMRVPSGLTLAE